jgi:hypothetical protein
VDAQWGSGVEDPDCKHCWHQGYEHHLTSIPWYSMYCCHCGEYTRSPRAGWVDGHGPWNHMIGNYPTGIYKTRVMHPDYKPPRKDENG